jgi:hypothetical protein
MAKAGRFPALTAPSAASVDQSAGDRSLAGIFITVVIFSMVALLVSLAAALLGLPGA